MLRRRSQLLRSIASAIHAAFCRVVVSSCNSPDCARIPLNCSARFERAYRPGYFLRIESLDAGKFDLLPIQAVNWNGGRPTVTLAAQVCPQLRGCMQGRCLVNPVQLVEYVVRTDPPADRSIRE